MLGDFATAKSCFDQIFAEYSHLLSSWIRTYLYHEMGHLALSLSQLEIAQAHFQQALTISRQDGAVLYEGLALRGMGHVYLKLGQIDAAQAQFDGAYARISTIDKSPNIVDCLTDLVKMELVRGGREELSENGDALVAYIQENPFLFNSKARMNAYLVCYQMLAACSDPRSAEILKTGHNLLQGWVENLDDKALQQVVVENIPAHQQICQLWQQHFAE